MQVVPVPHATLASNVSVSAWPTEDRATMAAAPNIHLKFYIAGIP